ncbi:MAG: Polyribonucleotide nucleotidyltransferase [Phycisphaerae bacterium]|nr:Polyribonucleotide nucleotidyltransferase [Phycisphaerae bacterium]
MAHVVVSREIAGRTLTIETGKIGRQAAGSVWIRYADTVVFVGVVRGGPRPGGDFMPLTVDYREKTYAAGKIPGGFFKREGRPTVKEILTMRLIDRPIRPMFPDGFLDEILIQAMVLSHDQENEPDILSMIGASAALSISGVPFSQPLGAVRIGRVDGQLVINPTVAQMEYSDMELVLGGHAEEVNMIELGGREVGEADVLEAIRQGHAVIRELCAMQKELVSKAGKPVVWEPKPRNEELRNLLQKRCYDEFRKRKSINGKLERNDAVSNLYREVLDEVAPEEAENPQYNRSEAWAIMHEIEGEVVRDMLLESGVRADGRPAGEIREIECEIEALPRTHGSSIFQRGETQALVTATLGTVRDEQIVDGLTEEYSKKFMLHYNFPPICTGEVKKVGAVSRREIGHGNLAEKALEAVLPTPDKFPYTIRLVSDIMESNGSSSMATVCGGTLALMDAGVPIVQPVAGISIGMFHKGDRHMMLVDILGEEDHFGDMDFKVAGTQRGITAIQLDLKAAGISFELIREAITIAREARLNILRRMLQTIPRPKSEPSRLAPRILTIKINPENIGRVIGPGGKGIKGIEAKTGAQIEIEDDGTVYVSSIDAEMAEQARNLVEAAAAEVKIGRIYHGRVMSIKDFGAFIEILPGQDGLCHISELSQGFVKNVNEVCKIGDEFKVKVINIDDQGRIKLSKKAADAELATANN